MQPIRRVLHVLDPTLAETPGLDRCLTLARAAGAEVWLALYEPGPRLGFLGILDRAEAHRLDALMRNQLSGRLEELAQRLRERTGLTIHTIDEPVRIDARQIVESALRHRVDLVTKDAGHVSALRRLVTLPLDWDLLRASTTPVWLVAAGRTGAPQRIAAAVDPVHAEHGAGQLNASILDTARVLASTCQAELRVMSAFAELPAGIPAPDPMGCIISTPFEGLRDRLLSGHRAALSALVGQHGIPLERTDLLFGPPPETLADAVETQAVDVLVVGVVRRAWFDRVWLGSTAERLIAHAPCDVVSAPDPATAAQGA